MRFLLGESMGGAVVLLLARKKPDFWDGAVLVAPMCKVCDYPILPFILFLSVIFYFQLFLHNNWFLLVIIFL